MGDREKYGGGPITLAIAALGAQGHGEAVLADGTRAFVPFTLPGETVEVAEPLGGAGERLRLLRVLTPAPDRQAPVCQHFGRCGGCAVQHASPGLYQLWKRELVAAAFAQRGIAVVPEPLLTVPVNTRRRAVFSARRGRSGVLLGFHAEAEAVIVPLTQCPILTPGLTKALPDLIRLAETLASHRRDTRLAVTETTTGLDIAVSDARTDLSPDERQIAARAAAVPRFARVTVAGEVLAQSAEPVVRLSGVPVTLPPGAFLQATLPSEAAVTTAVLAAIDAGKGPVADLFAGLGTFTFALAGRWPVTAVESDREAFAALSAAVRRAPTAGVSLKAITPLKRDLMREPLAGKELQPFHAVVFDPPRAGAAAQAAALAASPVPCVIAVSCNPATLARDARTLIDGGYELMRVIPIDQFLYAPHVEAVAVFKRPARTEANRGKGASRVGP